ncbi:hypothetical protein CEUSTIGMA_g5269.t1 [Chlamydomonas eustigma]|uniref:Uncharacterized protein n=1 Tax=Chlamydomonas eustigma TaxID=1157962 RepID=A0A250X445_9CHLO|nr:hypothetical protein CEUSTIGMA_g5269.t1 [Chlamydomonas eustigma]|eukprot:GAX77826.1 hypothetical protein CEUSTIGMA_g5269.t1 [Chlamydomonas eustigma]
MSINKTSGTSCMLRKGQLYWIVAESGIMIRLKKYERFQPWLEVILMPPTALQIITIKMNKWTLLATRKQRAEAAATKVFKAVTVVSETRKWTTQIKERIMAGARGRDHLLVLMHVWRRASTT